MEALRASRPMGLGRDQADALLAFAHDVALGLEHALPTERHRIFLLLRLQATITPALFAFPTP